MVVSGATLYTYSPTQMGLRNSAGKPKSLLASALQVRGSERWGEIESTRSARYFELRDIQTLPARAIFSCQVD